MRESQPSRSPTDIEEKGKGKGAASSHHRLRCHPPRGAMPARDGCRRGLFRFGHGSPHGKLPFANGQESGGSDGLRRGRRWDSWMRGWRPGTRGASGDGSREVGIYLFIYFSFG